MPTLLSLPDGRAVPVGDGETVLAAMASAGIALAHACGGQAKCSTCRLRIVDGLENCLPRTDAERTMSHRLRFGDDIRLGCQTRMTGDATVRRLVLDDADAALASEAVRSAGPASIGRLVRIAILFADIDGFTALSDALPAYDVVHLLDRHFDRLGGAVLRHGGVVGNTMGDGLMALFGLDDAPDAAPRAALAGLAILDEAARLAAYVREAYGRPYGVRVGLHEGEAVVGTIGSGAFRRETAIGDAINVASRIEQANKSLGTRYLVSEETLSSVAGVVETGRRFPVELRGKAGTHAVHEVLGPRRPS